MIEQNEWGHWDIWSDEGEVIATYSTQEEAERVNSKRWRVVCPKGTVVVTALTEKKAQYQAALELGIQTVGNWWFKMRARRI